MNKVQVRSNSQQVCPTSFQVFESSVTKSADTGKGVIGGESKN